MTTKEKFLKIKTCDEYDARREEFEDLDVTDKEVLAHFDEIFPTLDNSDFENGIIIDLNPKTK